MPPLHPPRGENYRDHARDAVRKEVVIDVKRNHTLHSERFGEPRKRSIVKQGTEIERDEHPPGGTEYNRVNLRQERQGHEDKKAIPPSETAVKTRNNHFEDCRKYPRSGILHEFGLYFTIVIRCFISKSKQYKYYS